MSVLKSISVRLNLFVFGSCFRTLAVILFQIIYFFANVALREFHALFLSVVTGRKYEGQTEQNVAQGSGERHPPGQCHSEGPADVQLCRLRANDGPADRVAERALTVRHLLRPFRDGLCVVREPSARLCGAGV